MKLPTLKFYVRRLLRARSARSRHTSVNSRNSRWAWWAQTVDTGFKVVQTLSIISAGIWLVIEYRDFKRENNEITLKTAQLDYDTQELKLFYTQLGRLDFTLETDLYELESFDDGTKTLSSRSAYEGEEHI